MVLMKQYCYYCRITAATGIILLKLAYYGYYRNPTITTAILLQQRTYITNTTGILLILLVLHCYHYHTDVTTGILLLPLAKCWYHWHIAPATIYTTASTSKLLQQRKELQQSACCEEHLHPQDCILIAKLCHSIFQGRLPYIHLVVGCRQSTSPLILPP